MSPPVVHRSSTPVASAPKTHSLTPGDVQGAPGRVLEMLGDASRRDEALSQISKASPAALKAFTQYAMYEGTGAWLRLPADVKADVHQSAIRRIEEVKEQTPASFSFDSIGKHSL